MSKPTLAPPDVSIILPTYNRIDTIGRAVESVRSQTVENWELIIVDDGSRDRTHELVSGLDERIRVIRQPNAGVGAARNTGLAASRGRYITFLDSDDAWLPNFLALTTSFLQWSDQDHFVTTEFLQDFGDGRLMRHNLDDIPSFLRMAQRLGSRGLTLPEGEVDEYLRIYSSREPLGRWADAALKAAGQSEGWLYRGSIHDRMRWGYLNWLPVTMITRHAMETVGPFATHRRSAEDFRFLAMLAKNFRANMIGVAGAIKYEKTPGKGALKQDHLATGRNAYAFAIDKLEAFDDVFADQLLQDAELRTIRRYREYYAGLMALCSRLRKQAVPHLDAAACWAPQLRSAFALAAVARVIPSNRIVAFIAQAWIVLLQASEHIINLGL